MKKRYVLGVSIGVFAALAVWWANQQVAYIGIPPSSGVIDFTIDDTFYILADLDTVNLRLVARRDTLGFESRELPLRIVWDVIK